MLPGGTICTQARGCPRRRRQTLPPAVSQAQDPLGTTPPAPPKAMQVHDS
jgi:hypothetical protein